MDNKQTAVFGIYATVAAADTATDRLVNSGFAPASISALLPKNVASKPIAIEKATNAPEGATAGASTGPVLGGALGRLAIGALAIPGFGSLIAVGPIVAGLVGLGIGEVAGRFTAALIGMGIPEDEAMRYEKRLQNGGILLSVHCNTSEIKRAEEIMKATSAEDVSSTNESSSDVSKAQTVTV
jgi:hypothetical protein